ncbi:hypothetical protein GGU11DRAFT_803510 [Lentinula aff. detonsa]|nr:hypothetical protein GGU11DRAFT_803510 [Lentinula aff. detonsa]
MMKNKFLDLAAQEDSDGGYESPTEDADEEAEAGPSSKRSRNGPSDDEVLLHPRLENVVNLITDKYVESSIHTLEHGSEELLPALLHNIFQSSNQTEDWPLWRVKCSPGEEYHVLYLLMSKHKFLSRELRSAFFNPQNPGTVYLEASFIAENTVDSLSYVLRTLSNVKAWTLTVIPSKDAPACFTLSKDSERSLRSPGEWVKIKRGLYRDDVGVVVDTFDKWGGMSGAKIALVPRLAIGSQKRSRLSMPRPPPQLFKPETSESPYSHLTFEHGLIIKTFHSTNIVSASVIPSELISPFHESQHPLVRHATMPIPTHWQFDIGEVVWVSDPTNPGLTLGKIHAMDTTRVLQQIQFEVDTDGYGIRSYSPFDLFKVVQPGDYVSIVVGEQAGKTGFVVSRNETLLTIAHGRFTVDPDIWAHVNSVKVMSSPIEATTTQPWIDVGVRLQSGPYASLDAIVKQVCPDGRGSLRLAVYAPVIQRTLDVDLFNVIESKTGKLLFEYQPLAANQQEFRIMPELKAMRTGKVPWVGLKVSIVAGHFKGLQAIVRDVNRYQLDPQRPFKRSGITITLERLVMGPTFNQLVQVDYDEVTFSERRYKLADIFPPSQQQASYYLPWNIEGGNKHRNINISSTKSISERQNASNADLTSDDLGSRTPFEFERAHIFTGVWSPSSRTPIWRANELITPWPENSNNANIDMSLPNSEPLMNHWILEPKLLGIAIRVDIRGGAYDTVEKRKKNGTFIKTVLESDNIVPLVVDKGGQRCPVSITSISKFHERPKPSTERALMVVIEGPHTGKFVRQVYHFFQMSKAPGNAKFIAAVTDRSTDVEFVTGEILDLDRDEVELVKESAPERRYMNEVLRDTRYTYRINQPEIRT